MRLAQFEDETGYFVGVWLKGRWVNFSVGMKVYAEVADREDQPFVGTILQLLSEDKFDIMRFKKVATFMLVHNLFHYLEVGREATLKAPIMKPPKVIALGRNYVLHAKEAKLPVPKEPIIFAKPGSCVIGPKDTVRIPREYGRMDHEAELAVVISSQARRVKKREAFQYIAGYTIAQDITARDLQNSDLALNNPWFRSKGFDTFMPLGPWLVLRDEITPPINLAIECKVNGRPRQKANTREMVFNIPTIMEFITKHITLEPGDVISTGTPEGIGEITPGDTITTRIDKIGEMKNKVRYATR